MDESEINERYEKWRKPMVACVAIYVFLILYLFAYPFLIVKIFDGDHLNGFPVWIGTALEWSVIPIDWIYDNVGWYRRLIDSWTGR